MKIQEKYLEFRNELEEAKKKLEARIQPLLVDFQNETGVIVDHIKISQGSVSTGIFDNNPKRYISSTKVMTYHD